MNFLYPQLLFGLCALAIPIIIHLFNFRRTKKVYFSNTRFLKKVKEASSSKLKIKHFLVLLSRMLFIFFLVLAFAQPYWNNQEATPPSDQVIIYLDNSNSMSNETDNGLSAFDEAIIYINELLDVYPKTTSYRLVTNDFDPFSNSFKSASEVEEHLTKITLSNVPREIAAISQRLTTSSNRDSLDVYWISDFQKSSTGSAVNFEDKKLNINLIPIYYASENNVFIDSVYVDNPFLIGDEQLTINVKVTNKGDIALNELSVKVFIDNIQSATATTNLPALGSETLSFNVTYDVNKLSLASIRIEEYPVTFDNEFYFVLDRAQRIKILELRDKNTGSYIPKVFSNSELFDFSSAESGNVDYSKLNNTDLVILNGIQELSSSLALVINDRLEKGEKVLLIPSEKPDISSYQLVTSGISESTMEDRLLLATPDFGNPFFEKVFEEKSNRFAMAQAQPVLDLGIDRSAILKFENGNPFLRESNGLYIMATPLQAEQSTFQSHALFVPVMYRIAISSVSHIGQLYYYVDDNRISIDADSLALDRVYKLIGNNSELIPDQRNVAGRLLFEVPKYVLGSGFYSLVLDSDTLSTLAFNNMPSESDLTQLTAAELSDKIKGNVKFIDAGEALAFRKKLESRYAGTPLWKFAIMLALLFLLMEVLLIRFFP